MSASSEPAYEAWVRGAVWGCACMWLLICFLRNGQRGHWCLVSIQVKGYKDPSNGGDLILGDCEHLLTPACHHPDVNIAKPAQLICGVTTNVFSAGPFSHRALLTLHEKHVPFTQHYVDLKNKPDWCAAHGSV